MKSSSAHAVSHSLSADFPIVSALEVVNTVVNAALEAKGLNVVVLDVRDLSDVANYFVLVNGRSDRQVQGITNRVVDACDQAHIDTVAVEGLDKAQWVLVDFGDVLLHVFYEPMREHYDLESLWIKGKTLKVSKPNKKGIVKVS